MQIINKRMLLCALVVLFIQSACATKMKPKKIPALGRPFQLGDLYNMADEKIIKGPKLWTREKLAKFNEAKAYKTNFEISADESVGEKMDFFNVEASFKLEFMGGLIEVEGAAKYLKDQKKTSDVARVSLQYESQTFYREMYPSMYTKVDFPDVLEKTPDATHVVTAVQYGAGAVFVFDRTIETFEDKSQVEGQLRIKVHAIPGIKIEGEGKVEITEAEKKNTEKFFCKFHGDFVLDNHPASYEDAIRVYKELPKLLGENFENSVPTKVWLYPLEDLPISKASMVLHEISNSMVNKVVSEIEDLQQLQVLCNDILKSRVAQYHFRIKQNVKTFRSKIEQFLLFFQQELAQILPKVKGGGQSEKALAELLFLKETSIFGKHKLRSWINHQMEESIVLDKLQQPEQKLPNLCKNDGEFAAQLQNKYKYTLALTLGLDTLKNEFIDKMTFYLEKKQNETLGIAKREIVGLDDKWWNPSNGFASQLHKKTSSFRSFYLEDKKKEDTNIQFAVREALLDPSKNKADQGIRIELYEYGQLIDPDYQIPSATEEPVMKQKSHASITIQWTEPDQGSKNVKYYEITTKKVLVSNSTDIDIENTYIEISPKIQIRSTALTIKRLEANQQYVFSVGVFCAFGKTAESVQSSIIETLPCPTGMFHVTKHECKLCTAGKYSDEIASESCTECPLGTYREQKGGKNESDCNPCPKGTYSAERGVISFGRCKKCPVGTYNDKERSPSMTDCMRCPPGSFSNKIGQTSSTACIPCRAGSYQPNEGQTKCIDCINGNTTNVQGAINSEACMKGTFDDNLNKITSKMTSEMKNVDNKITSEVKRINNLERRGCVTGYFHVSKSVAGQTGWTHDQTVNFGRSFFTHPTVAASIAGFERTQQDEAKGDLNWGLFLTVTSTGRSSATIRLKADGTRIDNYNVAWVACATP